MKHLGLVLIVTGSIVIGCGGARHSENRVPASGNGDRIVSLRHKVAKHRGDPGARMALAQALKQAAKYAEAAAQFDTVLSLQPELLEAQFGRAEALLYAGRATPAHVVFLDLLRRPEAERYVPAIAALLGSPYAIRQLTFGNGDNLRPRYSPVANEIVFQSNRDGNWEIYRFLLDSGLAVRFTHDPAADEAPEYSTDGARVFFTSRRGLAPATSRAAARDVYVMDAEGNDPVPVIIHAADDWDPVVDPTGRGLLFVSDRNDHRPLEYGEKQSDIFYLRFADSTVSCLTQGLGDKSGPAFSRDGGGLIYACNANGTFEIFAQGLEAANPTRLISGFEAAGHPQYAADGRRVAFFAKASGNIDLYVYDLGSERTDRLTCEESLDLFPSFSRQGDKVLFCSNRTGTFQIYELNLSSPIPREQLAEKLSQMVARAKAHSD